MPSEFWIRGAIAMVWLYQGLWLKILAREPRHQAIAGAVPFLSPRQARAALFAIGLFECALALWVLSGQASLQAALVQTVVLTGMNTCGILWASRFIPDPAGMVLQNLTFLLLVWTHVR